MWRAAERRAATLYRRAVDSGDVNTEDPAVEAALARVGGGQPLHAEVRRRMELELGVSLERVRIHTDSVAAQAVRAVRAEAFTVGEDIFFGEGAFAPETERGAKLLAHELTHVVQGWQRRTDVAGSGVRVSRPGDHLEREADAVAERLGALEPAATPRDPAQAREGATERLQDELTDDPRARLAEDPLAWRAAALSARLAGGRDDAPVASEVPYRAALEAVFGESFASVRVYMGQDRLLAPLGARAAAWREGIAFAGVPSQALVAHELAHIVQMRTQPSRPGRSSHEDAAESEADSIARAVAGGARQVGVSGTARAAEVSFGPGDPQVVPAPASMETVVRDAIDRAQSRGIGFGDAMRTASGLPAAIAAMQAANGTPVVDAVVAAARMFGTQKVNIQIADKEPPIEVTFDEILAMLAGVFLGPELEAHGLPRSFGNDLALDLVIHEITGAFDDALRAAAAFPRDNAGAAKAFRARIAEHQSSVEAAVESITNTWDSPNDLVELEIEGAIGKLSALRQELAQAKLLEQQRELGGKIAHLARYILLLNAKLGDLQARRKSQKGFKRSADLSTLAAAGGMLHDARAPIGSEQQTLMALGNKAALLGEQDAVAVTGDGDDVLTTTVLPEEAFAHHTDDAMADAQEEIAGQARQQERDLAEQLAKLAPPQVKSRAELKQVYARWFGFFSKAERDDQVGQMMRLYELAMPLISKAPLYGLVAYYGMQNLMVQSLRMPGASDSFASEIGKVQLDRVTATDDVATRAGDAGIDYRFGQVRRSDGGTGVASERASRNTATRDAVAKRKRSMDAVQQQPAGPKQDQEVVNQGLAPAPRPGEPLRTALQSKSDYARGRDGTDTGWNYLLAANVGLATGKLEIVYEHKAMRDDAARYLFAVAQHLHTLQDPHELRDPANAKNRLGDAAGRAGDVEGSTASASRIYGAADDRGARRSAAARAEIAASRERANLDPKGGTSGGVSAAARILIGALERSCDSFFASADPKDRLLAIILEIGVHELDLDESLWALFTPEAFWEFAKQAMVIGAMMFALHRLGPAGQLLGEVVQRVMMKDGERDMAAVALGLVGWLEGATQCTSFVDARMWAFTFRQLAVTVAMTARDWIAMKVGGKAAQKAGEKWEARRTDPRTVGEMRKQLRPFVEGNPKIQSEMARQLEANLTAKLEPGQPLTPEQQTMWAMLNAVDEAAAARIAAKHRDLPKLTDKSPLSADPTLSAHTPLNLAKRAKDIRADIDAHLAKGQTIQPYRVEVLTAEQFKARFASQQGRSALIVEEGGRAVVYARADARKVDIHDEAIHLLQLNDPRNPKLAESIRMLGDATTGQWEKLDLGMRKNLFERKLEVEIDAKHRRLAELRSTDPEWREINGQLRDLERLQARSQSITPDQLQQMQAAPAQAPEFLRDPAYLFAKARSTSTTAGQDMTLPSVDASKVKRTVVHDSPAANLPNVKRVEQFGDPWENTTVVTANNGGTLKIDPKNPNKIAVGGREYVLEDGAKLNPKLANGDDIQAGIVLAVEPPERFRRVDVIMKDGTVQQRLELFSKRRGNKWVRAGEDSSRRGVEAEKAVRKKLGEELDQRKAADAKVRPGAKDQLTHWMRIEHQTAQGQGFDDVLVEFHGNPPVARVRIIEVKDYPNRLIQYGEMSAIRENLNGNMTRLREDVAAAVDAKKSARRPPYKDLTNEQLKALDGALKSNDLTIELHLGETTRVGAESRKGSVLSQLRAELKTSFGGKDVLVAPKEPP